MTEVGRQPWVVYGFLRTADAVSPVPGLVVTFVTFTLLYLFLAGVVAVLLRQQVRLARARTGAPRPMPLDLLAAGVLLAALIIYALSGGADFGGGRVGPAGQRAARRRPARADCQGHRPHLGGQQRVAGR